MCHSGSSAHPEGGGEVGQQALPSPAEDPASTAVAVVGRCLVCARPWDDYSSRTRCGRCRILLLVCGTCHQERGEHPQQQRQQRGEGLLCGLCQSRPPLQRSHQRRPHTSCSSPGKGCSSEGRGSGQPRNQQQQRQAGAEGAMTGSVSLPGGGCAAIGARPRSSPVRAGMAAPGGDSDGDCRRLRILCLHGFRQTGRKLMVRGGRD